MEKTGQWEIGTRAARSHCRHSERSWVVDNHQYSQRRRDERSRVDDQTILPERVPLETTRAYHTHPIAPSKCDIQWEAVQMFWWSMGTNHEICKSGSKDNGVDELTKQMCPKLRSAIGVSVTQMASYNACSANGRVKRKGEAEFTTG